MTMRTEIRELRRGMNQEPPGDHSESPSIVCSLGSESACQLTCVFNLIFYVARWIYKVTAYSSEEETRASFLSSQQVMGLWFVGPPNAEEVSCLGISSRAKVDSWMLFVISVEISWGRQTVDRR